MSSMINLLPPEVKETYRYGRRNRALTHWLVSIVLCLAGAVALTGVLAPVAADLAARFPGTAVLGEPGYRTVSLPDVEAVEGLSVIFREGLGPHLAPGVTPLLAAALTEPPGDAADGPPGAPGGGRFFDGRDPDWLADWWEAYVRHVAPPVLHALFGHGVVFEPHLQNVLVGVDDDGLPVQAVLRDLEGVKLVAPRHDQALAALKPEVARALGYDAERGWHRVAYCLFVNHLAEIAAAIADRQPDTGQPYPGERFEAVLWDRARTVLTGFAREHGWPSELLAVLAGVPLPAKANLRLRWARGADREAAYLSVRNPPRRAAGQPRYDVVAPVPAARPAAPAGPPATPAPAGPGAAPAPAAPPASSAPGPAGRLALPAAVRELAERLGRADDGLPAYVYDLDELGAHLAAIRGALPGQAELFYAVKANPDPQVLRVVARWADGLEVASAGELAHAAAAVPGARLAFGGPGKTPAEIAAAVRARAFRFHVESPHELRHLGAAALAAGTTADILLRVNLPGDAAGPGPSASSGAGLVMGGAPTRSEWILSYWSTARAGSRRAARSPARCGCARDARAPGERP